MVNLNPNAVIHALDAIYRADPSSYTTRHVGPNESEFSVWSITLHRWFTGPTLTIARHNRSENERVYREHHAKNSE